MAASSSKDTAPGTSHNYTELPKVQENDVQLYVYDLSRGLAKSLSLALIGTLKTYCMLLNL
jgi:hypothetical protein